MGSRATAALEFALIAPLMLLAAAGVVETGAILRAYATVDRVVMQYAVSYADCSDTSAGVCQTELASYTSAAAITNVAPQLVQSALTLRMFEIRMVGTVPTVMYAYPTSATLTANEISVAQSKIPTAGIGVVVSATYLHTLIFFANFMQSVYGNYLSISYTTAQLKN